MIMKEYLAIKIRLNMAIYSLKFFNLVSRILLGLLSKCVGVEIHSFRSHIRDHFVGVEVHAQSS